uniref:Putative ovule protein n=1 Tax=Solanum chacoense TaxID=4108 RepID=A0A0V0H201_SOLCH
MCCLESKISGGDPSISVNVFRVKPFEYDSPGHPKGPRRGLQPRPNKRPFAKFSWREHVRVAD